MEELLNQLFLQMAVDTIRAVMVIYGICILYAVSEVAHALLKLIGKLIVKCSKTIWKFVVRKVIKRPKVEVTEDKNMEV